MTEQDPVLDALEKAGVGSVFTKTRNGWSIQLVKGGVSIPLGGATLLEALTNHGVVRTTDTAGVKIK